MDPYNPYMRPPQQQPPPTADPNLYHHQQPPRPPPPPLPPQTPWYPNQFLYSSPSPHQNWAPPPPPPPPQQQQQSYPPLPPPPYPNQTHHFPPLPPCPHPPPHLLTSCSPLPNQVFRNGGNQNWVPQQGWNYPVAAHNNAEDWAARARAWAAAKQVAMDDQHLQPSFQQVANPEEQNLYHDQYFRAADAHGQDGQQQQFPAMSYQDFAVAAAPMHQPLVAHPQEPAPFSYGASSYIPDEHLSYPISAGASSASPSVHKQEVPSSYSSVKGREDQEQQYKSFPLSSSSTQEGQLSVRKSPHPSGGAVLIDHSMQYEDQEAEFRIHLNDHPLEIGSNDPSQDLVGMVRVTAPVTTIPSVSSWMPGIASGSIHPPIPPVPPPGPQLDSGTVLPSSVTGNAATQFGSYPPASSFQPTAPSAASYGLATGIGFHPTTGFPGDAFGFSNSADRPKKASVPNWLKEEIIKNASVITRPFTDHPKEETQSIEDEGVDKSFGKDLADRKSIDSFRSTEDDDDDDDEDVEDATRTAVINQEIKRILTEVLLKVTDELFDEIATKVLDEDDSIIEVENISGHANHKMSASPPVPNKAAAKIVVPVKGNETEIEEASENLSSDAPGNILGLAYATDEDDDNDNEILSSSVSSHTQVTGQQLSNSKISEKMHFVAENGSIQAELGISRQLQKPSAAVSDHGSSKMITGARDAEISVNGGKVFNNSNKSQFDAGHRENLSRNFDATVEKFMIDDSQSRAIKMSSNQDNWPDSEGIYAAKGSMKETEIGRADDSEYDYHRRQDEKIISRSEKTGDRHGLQEINLEQGDTTRPKFEDFDSKKKTSEADVKENRKQEKLQKASAREDDNKKRTRLGDKEEDRARYNKHTGEASRHKRRHSRSPSLSSRGRNSKDNNSSDEASKDVKRKSLSRKRHSSPSPVRSRRRHVSRSPHSKHSQRRNSPYSSLEMTRRRRSRSKSPWRRRR